MRAAKKQRRGQRSGDGRLLLDEIDWIILFDWSAATAGTEGKTGATLEHTTAGGG
jgi:hypothetical protein